MRASLDRGEGTMICAVLIAAASAGLGQDHDRGRCRHRTS
jgi:hypothetical protein